MLIDWFTVAAQLVNFLILVWLLKHFLYRPILNAVEQREAAIKSQLETAALQMSEAEVLKAHLTQEKAHFEDERETLINQALDEAEAAKNQLAETAKREYEAQKAKQQALLLEEEAFFRKNMGRQTQAEVFNITRKAVSDLASEQLEAQMTDTLIQKLKALPSEEERLKLKSIFKSESVVEIHSTQPIDLERQRQLSEVLEAIAEKPLALEFKLKQELICGLEIVTEGHKMPWHVDDYLKQLQKGAGALSKKRTELLLEE